MKDGEQIDAFGKSVDQKLAAVRQYLPEDLILARTSDQPLQVKENISLFMDALYEAIILVVLVSLIGFWEWRSAVLMAISIPITLAMTFGMMYLLGIDIQQVSRGDVDHRSRTAGGRSRGRGRFHQAHARRRPSAASSPRGWDRRSSRQRFSTPPSPISLPTCRFFLLTGSTGEFLFSLPIVMTCSLVASRLVSMTFIPYLGYYITAGPRKKRSLEERRHVGLMGYYARIARSIRSNIAGSSSSHRWSSWCRAAFVFAQLKSAFFPEDVQYWSYVDVWLPNDANLGATNQVAKQDGTNHSRASREVRPRASREDGKPMQVLRYVTSFVGGGGPRFWFSASPQLQQLNYAQVIIELTDKEVTPRSSPVAAGC